MRKNKIPQIPILDKNGKLLGIDISNNLLSNSKNEFSCALLMAGSQG